MLQIDNAARTEVKRCVGRLADIGRRASAAQGRFYCIAGPLWSNPMVKVTVSGRRHKGQLDVKCGHAPVNFDSDCRVFLASGKAGSES